MKKILVLAVIFLGLSIPCYAASIFDEKFEGAGYEETGWNEVVGAGTVDEDAASSDVSSPSGWGSQCLKVIAPSGGTSMAYNDFGDNAIAYYRVEVVVTSAESANNFMIFHCYNTNGGAFAAVFWGAYDGADLTFALNSYHDGNSNAYNAFGTYSLSTRYRIEIKWDATNDKWSWKIDGVVQPNDQDASSPVTTEGNLTDTHQTTVDAIYAGDAWGNINTTTYYDLIAIDNADWVGAEVTTHPQVIIINN